MLNDLGDKIVKTIKETHLKPKPRWHFLLKNKFIWTLGLFSLLVGAAAISVILYLLNNNNLALHESVGESFFAWLLLFLPYFWLIFLALFIWLLYYNIKHTSRGYRYHPFLIVVGAIFISIFLGSIFFTLGLGKKIDSVLGERAPLYDVMFNPQIEMWSRPHHGRLSGLIISRQSNIHFIISDRNQNEWQIVHNGQGDNFVISGQVVRLMGRISGDREFKADRIMPMHPGRDFFLRLKPEMRQPLRLNMMRGVIDCSPHSNSLNNQEIIQIIEEALISNQTRVKESVKEDANILQTLSCLGLSQEFLLQMAP